MQLWIGITSAGLASACTLENPGFTGEASTSSASDSAITDSSTTSTSNSTETMTNSSSGSETGSTSSTSSTSGGLTSAGPSSSGDVTTDATTDATTTDGMCEGEPIVVFFDEDDDQFGSGPPMTVCPGDIPPGYVGVSGDCNDDNDLINPGAIEECDGVDNNCNGITDEYSQNNDKCDILDTTCYLKEYDGHYYYACMAQLKASSANNRCKMLASNDAKSYHVMLTSINENTEMEPLLGKLGSDASIGLMDKSIFNDFPDFIWVADGSKVVGYGSVPKTAPWAPGSPDKGLEQWTKIHANGLTWDDIGGGEKNPFICEAEPPP